MAIKMLVIDLVESDLRQWLRAGWKTKPEPVWIEAARGGSVGAPDVFLPLDGKDCWLPVELKCWDGDGGNRIEFSARPSQRRFHLLAAQARKRTAFLALVRGDGLHYVTLPGEFMPRNGWRVCPRALVPVESVQELAKVYNSDKFWKGKYNE